jgi:hypothetical protein
MTNLITSQRLILSDAYPGLDPEAAALHERPVPSSIPVNHTRKR